MKALFRPFVFALAGATAAPALVAQETQPAPVRLSFEQPVGVRAHTGIATINPFAVILGGLSGDVEVNIGTGMTGALSVSWFPDDLNYTAADFTFRYYPGERNPEGFSVGASVGYLSAEHDDGDRKSTRLNSS